MVDAGELVLRVRSVHVDEPDFGQLERHHAPLGIKMGHAEFVDDLEGLLLGEHGGSRVALALGVTPIIMVAGQIEIDLALLKLGFLQRKHIGVEFREDLLEAFLHNSTQAVHIP